MIPRPKYFKLGHSTFTEKKEIPESDLKFPLSQWHIWQNDSLLAFLNEFKGVRSVCQLSSTWSQDEWKTAIPQRLYTTYPTNQANKCGCASGHSVAHVPCFRRALPTAITRAKVARWSSDNLSSASPADHNCRTPLRSSPTANRRPNEPSAPHSTTTLQLAESHRIQPSNGTLLAPKRAKQPSACTDSPVEDNVAAGVALQLGHRAQVLRQVLPAPVLVAVLHSSSSRRALILLGIHRKGQVARTRRPARGVHWSTTQMHRPIRERQAKPHARQKSHAELSGRRNTGKCGVPKENRVEWFQKVGAGKPKWDAVGKSRWWPHSQPGCLLNGCTSSKFPPTPTTLLSSLVTVSNLFILVQQSLYFTLYTFSKIQV